MPNGYYLAAANAEAYDAECATQAVTRDDIAFYLDLALQTAAQGLTVLELGCGTGRVTLPIAAAGVEVTGLDAAPAMLAVARSKSAGAQNPRWVEADMTSFELRERFGLVIIPYRSFSMLLSSAQQRKCLAAIHRHLVSGGRLAFNLFNPRLVRRLMDSGDGRPDSEDGAIVRLEPGLRVRHVPRSEIERLLSDAGFEIEALYGWFDRRPFDDESSEMVWLARKPA